MQLFRSAKDLCGSTVGGERARTGCVFSTPEGGRRSPMRCDICQAFNALHVLDRRIEGSSKTRHRMKRAFSTHPSAYLVSNPETRRYSHDCGHTLVKLRRSRCRVDTRGRIGRSLGYINLWLLLDQPHLHSQYFCIFVSNSSPFSRFRYGFFQRHR